MRKFATVFVLLLLILVQIVVIEGGSFKEDLSSDPPSRGSAYINETTSQIAIGNDHIEFVLNKDVNCGITKIIDKSTGLDLRGNKVPPPIMLMIMYWTGNATDIVIQWDAESMDISGICIRDSALLYIYYYNFRGSNMNATVTMTLGDDDEFADFTLDIQNDEEFTIKSVFFPLIWGLGQIGDSAEDDRVFTVPSKVISHNQVPDASDDPGPKNKGKTPVGITQYFTEEGYRDDFAPMVKGESYNVVIVNIRDNQVVWSGDVIAV